MKTIKISFYAQYIAANFKFFTEENEAIYCYQQIHFELGSIWFQTKVKKKKQEQLPNLLEIQVLKFHELRPPRYFPPENLGFSEL